MSSSQKNPSNLFEKLSRRYSTPRKVQDFLRTLTYNTEENGETVSSAIQTYRTRTAHCLEASLLAAAILEHQGYPPLILSLDSKDNLCHSLFLFKEKTGWGAIGRSREEGLHGRAPYFRTVRDLAWSYYDPYVDDTGKLTGYVQIDLNNIKADWRWSEKNVRKVENYIVTHPHLKLRASPKRFQTLFKRFQEQGSLNEGTHWW